jgi:hypothetical protein
VSRGRVATAALAACAACASAVSAPLPNPAALHREPTPGASNEAPRLESPPAVAAPLRALSRARGIDCPGYVGLVEVDRGDLVRRVKEHIRRDVPEQVLRAEALVQKLLGAFPTGDDYEGATFAMVEAEVAAYYEPADSTMVVARDLDRTPAREAVAHELVHALQDRCWDLGARRRFVPGEDDRGAALAALAEGEALVLSREVVALAPSGIGSRGALAEGDGSGAASSSPDTSTDPDDPDESDEPDRLRAALLAPYVHGARFVRALRRRGGWRAVDAAWASPPATTEQVLHPAKWLAHEAPLVVADPNGPPGDAAFETVHSTTYGELGLRLALGAWMPASLAASTAAGWGGDRLSLFARGAREVALLWRVRFDPAPQPPDAYASRAFAALDSIAARLGRVAARGPTSFCVERPGNGVFAVQKSGRDLVLAFGTAETAARRWRSAMGCAAALSWAADAR